jgi:tetratricopeptide (TPR) repeat protein
LKDFTHAKEDADVAIKIEPAQATGYMNRGRANLRLEQYDNALQDLNKSISERKLRRLRNKLIMLF